MSSSLQSPDTGSVQIVYVVLVGGRAVPAAVAARDMRLVRDAEVARELGAVVTTKAERKFYANFGVFIPKIPTIITLVPKVIQ